MTKYVKMVPIEAEQFDPDKGIIPNGVFDKAFESTTSDMLHQMADRALTGKPVTNWHVATLEGDLKVASGDWIATEINGEHWPIADDVFKKTYAELPVIPKVWANTIEEYKANHYRMDEIFTEWSWDYDEQELIARAWLDGYQVEEDE